MTTALQQKDARALASATSISLTMTSSLTAGSTVVGCVTMGSATPGNLTSVTVDGVTATLLTAVTDSGNSQTNTGFILKNVSAGAGVVTANFSISMAARALAAHEVGGANTGTQPDGENAKFWSITPGTGTDANTANAAITPSLDGCYFFCATQDTTGGSVHTAGTDFTRDTNGSIADMDFSSEHYIQTTAASHIGSWTESIGDLMLTNLIVVKAAVAGGATPTLWAQGML